MMQVAPQSKRLSTFSHHNIIHYYLPRNSFRCIINISMTVLPDHLIPTHHAGIYLCTALPTYSILRNDVHKVQLPKALDNMSQQQLSCNSAHMTISDKRLFIRSVEHLHIPLKSLPFTCTIQILDYNAS